MVTAPTSPRTALRRFLERSGCTEFKPSASSNTSQPTRLSHLEHPTYFLPDADRSLVRLRFEDYFPLEAAGIVIDPQLGTLGLVHILDSRRPVREAIEHAVEQASFLRHLIGEKRAQQPDPSHDMPYAIQVVFIDCNRCAPNAGQILHDILRSSDLPYALGIGFAPSLVDTELRHAFCWLLPATRHWFNTLQSSRRRSPGVAWSTLELHNFRRPGIRRWEKSPHAHLHVLHGHNGSGKSTLAEGFEFLLTGHSARLDLGVPRSLSPHRSGPQPAQLAPLVWKPRMRLNGASAPAYSARVRLFAPNSTRSPLLENDTARPRCTNPIPADSFRLDERLSDRLIFTTPEARFDTWFQAFFADLDQHRATRAEVTAKLRAAIEGLHAADEPVTSAPSSSGETDTRSADLRVAQVIEGLIGFARMHLASGKPAAGPRKKSVLNLAALLELLPGNIKLGPDAELDRLKPLKLKLPALLRQPLRINRRTGELLHKNALRRDLSAAITEDRSTLARWQGAITTDLDRLIARLSRDLYGRSGKARGGGHSVLNLWMRHVALADLHEKARVIAGTLASAPAASAEPFSLIAPPGSAAAIAEQATEHRRECDRLREEVSSAIGRARRGMTLASAQVRVGELGPLERAIDARVFGDLLDSSDKPALREIVRHRKPGAVRTLRIGSPGWTTALRAPLKARKLALERLAFLPASSISPAQRADWIVDAIDAVFRFVVLQEKGETRFIEELRKTRLAEAIEELVTLLTPASWAYAVVHSQVAPSDAANNTSASLKLTVGDHDAPQIFNTAERNALALALHLLCAPRVENPYRVIFLDDPLQNMDELTVTAVARGLSRFLRLWATDPYLGSWDIVLLLHGQDDCERILRECPAARYDFPWLSPEDAPASSSKSVKGRRPASRKTPELVEQVPGSEGGKLQDLTSLLSIEFPLPDEPPA
jgi:ATPase involved in DNA repair